ncbi:MAG: beta-N-acetylhexosaminidase, partial [Prevotella salivae]|nr:beta-N-acetylhexosaminidase [Segatella salivae]
VPTTAQAEYMVLPRMAALAEVQWMPAARKNYTEFVARVTRLACLYDHYGYTYALHIWPERYNHNRDDW